MRKGERKLGKGRRAEQRENKERWFQIFTSWILVLQKPRTRTERGKDETGIRRGGKRES